MPSADYSYSPGGQSVTTAYADPAPAAGAMPLGNDYASIFSEIIKDQLARRRQREALEDAIFKKQATAQLMPAPQSGSTLGSVSRPAGGMGAAARPAGGGGFGGPSFGSGESSAEALEEARLRSMQRGAAMSALQGPPVKFVGPDYTQSGFAGHYTPDVMRMNAAQRQAFLPQASHEQPPYAERRRY